MRKSVKKLLCMTAALAILASCITVPAFAEGTADWGFDGIALGTQYNTDDVITAENGAELVIGVAEADTEKPSIKMRAADDNYLEFNDSTTAGTIKQDSWTYTSAAPYSDDLVVYAADVKKGDTVKDTILFRVYDTSNTTSANSYGSDGRSFELKTADSGNLAFVDYYSSDDGTKAKQVTVPGFTYSANTWFSVKLEYVRFNNENTVKVYAGASADTVSLKASYKLGAVGSTKKAEAPILAPDKAGCYTPGGGTAVLGIDNLSVRGINYRAQNVPVKGTVYTTYSDDMKNKPEVYTDGGVTVVFRNESGAEITAAVGADGTYSTELMSDAVYSVTVTGADKYTLSPLSGSAFSIAVSDLSASKDILLVNNLGAVEYKEILEVGADKEYNTINKALSAVRKMNREAGQVVTIRIDPGTYEEQLYINVDDLALVAADPANRPLVQWYYGIGYVYYSAAPAGASTKEGWYNADYAVAKTAKNTVSDWGATLRTSKRGFRAENIDFISTFNKWITDTELADGIESGGKDAKNFDRSNKKTDVRTKNAKERAAAIYAGGSEIELYRCSFSSSQDTFGTGAASMYVKECDIAGNTDYICGGDNAYFEDCKLLWAGYSDTNSGGEITACKINVKDPNTIDNYHGYYFKNCTVGNEDVSGMKYPNGGKNSTGNWGRPWGNTNCKVIFDNTTIAKDASKVSKWGSMSGNPMTNAAAAYVINGVFEEGSSTDLTASDDNPKGTYTQNEYTLPEPEDFFGNWTPVHYVSESSKIKINVESNNPNCSVSVPAKAVEGETVSISANSTNKNFGIESISVKKTASGEAVALSENNTFVMPNEEVTVSAVFRKISFAETDFFDWYIGEQSSGSNDGAAEIVSYNGETALNITAKNAYLPLDTPVSSGKVTFDFDIYMDTTVDRNFRLYLENQEGTWQNTENVMAEVINNRGSQVNSGPDIDAKTNPLFTYAQLGASGWVKFKITLDYAKKDTNEFIAITASKPDGTQLGTAAMGVIAGKDTTLKSIRFVTTAAPSYYANVKLASGIVSEDVFYTQKPVVSGNTVTAEIKNVNDEDGVLFIAAAYNGSKLAEAKTAAVSKSETAQAVELVFGDTYADVRFYLWSGNSILPYSDVIKAK